MNLASFYQRIDYQYETNSYQKVKKIYNWISRSAQKLELNDLRFDVRFTFRSGEITYDTQSLDEFSEYAYGSKDFEFNYLYVSIYNGKEYVALVVYVNGCIVYADDKTILEKTVAYLTSTPLDEEKRNLDQQNNMETNQDFTKVVKKNDSKINQWLQAIGQNIISNGLWYLLTVLR